MLNMELLIILGIFFASFWLIRKNFKLSIYVLLTLSVFLHKELFSFFRWDLLPIRAFAFALLSVVIFELTSALFHRGKFRAILFSYFRSPPIVTLLVLWVINTLSLVNSANLKASILLLGFFTTSIVLFASLVRYFSDKEHKVLPFIKFYIFIAFALTVFGYIQILVYTTTGKIYGALWNIPGNIARVGSTFWDVNHYGALLAALLPIAAVLFLTERGFSRKAFYFVISVSMVVSLFLTNSRTAWILDTVALLSFLILLLLKRFGQKGILYLLIPLLIAGGGMGFEYSKKSSPFRAQIKQYFHYRLDSFSSHIMLLRGTFEIFQEYPIIGGGYGSFYEHFSRTKVSTEFFGRDPAAFNTRVPAHTIWGELLSGSGALGFWTYAIFILIIISLLIYLGFTRKQPAVSLMSLAMGSVVLGWCAAGIFYSYNSEFYWVLLALFYVYGVSQLKPGEGWGDILRFYVCQKSLPAYIVGVFALLLLFSGLGGNHLIPWDEAIYAKISKNIVGAGDWLNLYWKNGLIWYEKPPLFFWLQAAIFTIAGVNSLAVRLPSAILGLLTVVLTYKFSSKMFGRITGFVSALSLMTTVHFLYYARTGMLDVAVAFFITAALYAYYLASYENKKQFWFVSGACIGLSVMTKGAVGVLPLFIIGLSEVFVIKKNKMFSYVWLLLGTLLVAAPWHFYMYKMYGQAFINNYLGYHVFDRAISAIEDKGNPWWWYLIVIKVSMRIWAVTLVAALPFAVFKSFNKERRIALVTVWFLVVLAVFSVAKSKLVWYIIPLYPAAAILNGYFFSYTLHFIYGKITEAKVVFIEYLALFLLVAFSFTYFTLNYKLVFTSDLTGSQARLMEEKELVLGDKTKVFLDRIELPLAFYYLNGPFEILDFSPTNVKRVPQVKDSERLILLTKKGRFSEQVAGYSYAPTVIKEDGDWILWYMAPRNSVVQP